MGNPTPPVQAEEVWAVAFSSMGVTYTPVASNETDPVPFLPPWSDRIRGRLRPDDPPDREIIPIRHETSLVFEQQLPVGGQIIVRDDQGIVQVLYEREPPRPGQTAENLPTDRPGQS